MKPKDFQEETAKRIVEIFQKEHQNRVLLADEVGLGKTIIASAVVEKVSKWHKKINDDHFKVIYICSNINIANQNSKKLGIKEEDCLKISESRLSMQHLKIYQHQGTDHNYQQLIPLTPSTSFSMTGGCGNQSERALMLALLKRHPALKKIPRLSDFMRYYDLKYWDDFVEKFEVEAKKCNDNGSNYFAEMSAALEHNISPEMIDEIISICKKGGGNNLEKSRVIINSLRKIFAQISLDKLEPDLVIMDEFQRFKDLITLAEDESGMLAKKFLYDTNTKVLLLSATPYKPYSTLEEIGQDNSEDHYREFMQVMDFLLCDSTKISHFKEVWRGYSRSLSELSTANLTVLIAHKTQAEDAMYKSVCRTERFNTGIIDDTQATEIDISKGDILSYIEVQTLLNTLGIGSVPIDYVKSAPYLLSFMENYKLKENIVKQYTTNPSVALIKDKKTLLLRKSDINAYKQIEPNNARLKTLYQTVFDGGKSGMEKLLWLPANKPYYTTKGIFAKSKNLSKVLIFSNWEMVPRMIACMLSYESERMIYSKLNEDIDKVNEQVNSLTKNKKVKRYFAEESSKRRARTIRLKDDMEKVVLYPCGALSRLYSPYDYMGFNLDIIRKAIEPKVVEIINRLKKRYSLSEGNGSAGDYYGLMCLMDNNQNFIPNVIPYHAETLLTDIAIASPAVCAYRIFHNNEMAAELADRFVSIFNKTESNSVLDVLYEKTEDAYYENVMRYCAEGNLQAVLDEWAYVLGETGADLLDTMKKSFIDTATVQVDTYESFTTLGQKPRMRNHFAVGYFNSRLDDKNVQRTESIRCAFNSPFRPFVLATTSIGQEGLDFHLYCRKIMHWNLPSNPIDLEQREGRINRYQCLAIRQNITLKYGDINTNKNIWAEMFKIASDKEKQDNSDLVPFWCLPNMNEDDVRIERIVPMYPFSKDKLIYERLIKVLALYRLTLGQPRQEELLETIATQDIDPETMRKLFINLSPYQRKHRKNIKLMERQCNIN